MKTLNFKDRISLYYMAVSAILMVLTFFAIYYVVKLNVVQNIDKQLKAEAQHILQDVQLVNHKIELQNKADWQTKALKRAETNPIFIQVIDENERLIAKSPNLKTDELHFVETNQSEGHFNETLNKVAIRQLEIPIENQNSVDGYVIAATSLEASNMVLKNLRNVLFFIFLIKLFLYYFASRYLAGKNIEPIQAILTKIKGINENNLDARVELPKNKDEIYQLSNSFNNLLQRIENSFIREKQLTSEVSHELRIPLATIQGTLEVLLRKPRTTQEYEEKIQYCLAEIDNANEKMNRLIALTRLGLEEVPENDIKISIKQLIEESIIRHSHQLDEKEITINLKNKTSQKYFVSNYYSAFILDNFISNAIKYSKQSGQIDILIGEKDNKPFITIKDYGVGISESDIKNLFESFFRSSNIDQESIKGSGLGLSIARKAAILLNAKIEVDSKINEYTSFTIQF